MEAIALRNKRFENAVTGASPSKGKNLFLGKKTDTDSLDILSLVEKKTEAETKLENFLGHFAIKTFIPEFANFFL